MNDYKIPWDELSGEKNLKGTYKVTFLVDITEDDQMNIEDLHQALASSVSGDPVLNKISRLDLEKTTKEGKAIETPMEYKVGDLVIITEDIELEAKIEDHDGHLIVGAKNIDTNAVGKGILVIPAGSRARINKIEGNQVELIDFEAAMSASLEDTETNEISDVLVNVDSIIFENRYIAHVREDDENVWL